MYWRNKTVPIPLLYRFILKTILEHV